MYKMSSITLGTIKAGLGEEDTVKIDKNLKVNEDLQVTGKIINRRNIEMARNNSRLEYSGTSWQDIQDMSVTITISEGGRASLRCYGILSNTSTDRGGFIRIVRVGADENLFTGEESSNRAQICTGTYQNPSSIVNWTAFSFEVIDDLPGAGTFTYKLQIASPDTTTVTIGGRGNDTDNFYGVRAPTILIVEEV